MLHTHLLIIFCIKFELFSQFKAVFSWFKAVFTWFKSVFTWLLFICWQFFMPRVIFFLWSKAVFSWVNFLLVLFKSILPAFATWYKLNWYMCWYERFCYCWYLPLLSDTSWIDDMNVFATADICFHELILSASTSAGWTDVDINYDGAAKYGGATEFMKDLGSPAFFDVDITQNLHHGSAHSHIMNIKSIFMIKNFIMST